MHRRPPARTSSRSIPVATQHRDLLPDDALEAGQRHRLGLHVRQGHYGGRDPYRRHRPGAQRHRDRQGRLPEGLSGCGAWRSSAPTRHAYGPTGLAVRRAVAADRQPTSRGTVVVIHGGFWRAQYGLSLGRPLAADLVARGYTAWNIEYRRVGNGGGWPATLSDVAAAIDAAVRPGQLDVDSGGRGRGRALRRRAAGGLGGRTGPASRTERSGSSPRVPTAWRGLAGGGARSGAPPPTTGVGGRAVLDLLGGSPTRYRCATPSRIRRRPSRWTFPCCASTRRPTPTCRTP